MRALITHIKVSIDRTWSNKLFLLGVGARDLFYSLIAEIQAAVESVEV
jgi:hypothetical protein